MGLAAWTVTLWARTVWPWFGFFLSLTPVFLYSTALPATNGLEMAAGLLIWTSLAGLAQHDLGERDERALVLCAVPAVVALTTLRQLGPGFVAIIFGVAALLMGWHRVRTLLSRHTGPSALLGAAAAASLFAALWWMRASGSTALEPMKEIQESRGELISAVFQQTLAWNLQIIAAFPLRNEPAPPFVYAAYGLVLLGFIGAALLVLRGRPRVTLVVLIALTLALPLILTLMTVRATGLIWQGRYGLPLTVGVAILAGSGLDQRVGQHRLTRPLLVSGMGLLALSHAVSATHVLIAELENPVSVLHSGWLITSPFVVAGLALCAWGVWGFLLARSPAASTVTAPEPDPVSKSSPRSPGPPAAR